MKTKSILSLVLLSLLVVSVHAQPGQPNPILLDLFDNFSLAVEVDRNNDLRSFLKISDVTHEKIRAFISDPVNAANGSRISSKLSFGNPKRRSTDSIAKLEASMSVLLQKSVPDYKANEVRIWALNKLFPVPENAFTSPKVHQYLELDDGAIKSIRDSLDGERVSFEELRNGFRRERAKAILMDLPADAQMLFARYAGSEILNKFEQLAEQEGPLEFICYAIEMPNTMVQLTRNQTLHKQLQLSADQLQKICSIEQATILKIIAVDRRKSNNRNEDMALVQKQSFKETFSLLTETQNRRLQQWVANEFFEANPKRELSREDLRKYLGLNDKDEWNRTLELINERDSQLETQFGQLNALVVAKLLSVLPAKYKENASQLFQGVW